MAVELAPDRIQVNSVCPGFIASPLLDRTADAAADFLGLASRTEAFETMKRFLLLPRIGRPEEVAAAILFLASDDASFITGIALSVDGGLWAGPPPMMPIA